MLLMISRYLPELTNKISSSFEVLVGTERWPTMPTNVDLQIVKTNYDLEGTCLV